jgi:N-acetylglutamate synthase-like GNAT family acetyltransferase
LAIAIGTGSSTSSVLWFAVLFYDFRVAERRKGRLVVVTYSEKFDESRFALMHAVAIMEIQGSISMM